VTASISHPNDCPTAALGHTGVETHVSVNAGRVSSPPMTCMWTTNDDLPSAGDVSSDN